MPFAHPSLIVVSGPMGAGKTTLATALAGRLDRAAIINGYRIHQLIASGLCSPRTQVDADATGGEFGAQLHVRLRASCALARSFVADGFTAIIEEHVVGERIEDLLEFLGDVPFYFIQLNARFDILIDREKDRGTDGYLRWGSWDDLMAHRTPKIGLGLDNSEMSVDETIDAVMTRSDEALVPAGPVPDHTVDHDLELLLHGGEINSVVRVGDTVRRAVRESTLTIHQLLDHLQRVDFDGAPRVVGFDEQGREILSFISGEVTSGDLPLPDYLWKDETIVEVARLLRRLHEATASFEVPEDARWWWPVSYRPGRRVICHNDFAPWNVAFRDERPVGVIDWDLAAPGPVNADIARALWFFVSLTSRQQMSIKQRARRIRLFCDAYELTDRASVLEWVRQEELDVFNGVKLLAEQGPNGFRRMWEREDWHEGMRKDREFLEANFEGLGAGL